MVCAAQLRLRRPVAGKLILAGLVRVNVFGGSGTGIERTMRTLGCTRCAKARAARTSGECCEHGTGDVIDLATFARARRFLRRAFGQAVGPPMKTNLARGGSGGARWFARTRGFRCEGVNRDDQADGGSGDFARTIEEIRSACAVAK